MFGIDDMLIGGLILSALGTVTSANASASASRATERARLDAYRRQQGLQQQAEKHALDAAEDYRMDKRTQAQQKIQDRLENEYVTPAIDAQAISQQAATTQGDVSGDYQRAKAASDANVAQTTRNLARLMARTGSASLLRRNEAYKYADAASQIGLLQNFARGQGAVDEMKIADAANSGAGGNFLGDLMGSLGSVLMMGKGGLGAVDPMKSLDSVTSGFTSKLGGDLSKNFIGDARKLLFP